MTVIEKGILITAGVVFVGAVGYKIIKKKRPDLIKKAKKSVSDVKERTLEIIDGAKESFRKGYADAYGT